MKNMNVRRAIQTFTLAISIVAFVVFIKNKKEAILLLWMLSFSFASLLVGRIFCGYFCPFHAFDKGLGYIYNKVNFKKIKTPNLLKKEFIYYPVSIMLLLLVVLKIFSIIMPIKIKLPFLIIAFPILVFFTSDLWHNYLCPFGLVMKLPSLRRVLMPKIDNNTCTNCNICKNICPTEAIELNNKRLQIVDSRCILCYECEKICKFDSVKI
ncbi:MAG: hydrogenase subunit EhaP [Candidatus Methanofastidiosum methylothiophilum]|jgi:polyferredoxin|uniref:Hydrogenase subunit EhaP n=1 Tax=Candidatus Methanofastidiosum methylothiophilum TaxID=1705564 RepID=A0A150JK23_9EURY|nr:MAG: hydrogenase subunit EhaP [Candidatus Methanofastidiosum methylthiophilus]KYC57546.1 MAG: hydrogenase subunit EhaP [Candidatus Methanofastidiosum methylthiophilus]KYC57791.1 MAG: hydrogenase subunit EhaP [Candidatus Methanofastidiosum methylthiophilus]OQC51816.1 MAG: Ferredoxin [Euryarchaeota archaeon ADurb.Bin023]HQC25801.1 4Fe-4S binding protein [Methanofastidiosum sp.]